ncbi:cytochrome P450 [Xylaria castorea]|nr:cytochrome P450 [Xylaria castorea]
MFPPWQFLSQNVSYTTTNDSLHVGQLLSSTTTPQLIAFILGAFWLLSFWHPETPTVLGAPVHGRLWRWEPTFWLQSRFTWGARGIITSGYEKYKDRPFVIKRYDVNFTVLPHKYLDELRLVPESKLSGTKAQVQNIGHKWTGTDFMAESHLHFRALQNKLNAELPKYLDIAKAELDYAWGIEIPSSTDWQEWDVQSAIRMLVSRMSASVFVGHPACRNEKWLNLSFDYSIDIMTTAFLMRLFPTWSHSIVARLLPSRRRVAKNLRLARQIIEPLVDNHTDIVRKRAAGENVDEEDTILNWMKDNGTKDETVIDKLATRQLVISFASIHTTTAAITNVIFDLCAHPEWIPVLREEVEGVVKEHGSINSMHSGTKKWLQRLEKLDSFINESQRMNSILLLGPQRAVVESLTLKDGTHIPKGSRICWAGADHMNDPLTTPNPEAFDPMRSYQKRHSSSGQMNKHLAGQTSPENLSFGHGKLACPGRHFAVNEIKLLVARFITQYDIKFPDDVTSRPQNIYTDEFAMVDPKVKIMIRRRQGIW